MTDTTGIPKYYWLLAVLFLLWGLAGIGAFLSQLLTPYDQMVADMGKLAADCIKGMPTWLWAVYAVAVASGTLGSIALLLRRAWAQPLYLLSLATVIVQFGHSFLIAKIHLLMGWSAAIFPAFIIAMALIEYWFATSAKKKGWIA